MDLKRALPCCAINSHRFLEQMARRRRHHPWKEEWKDLFAMHRGERRGFTFLLVLCFIAGGWVTYEQWIRPRTIEGKEELEVMWWSMQDSLSSKEANASEVASGIHLFPFDPNDLPIDQWVALGLSERQAASIHRYEAKGGTFRKKSDVAKMHVVDPDLYEKWEPFIQLPDLTPYPDRKQFAQRTYPKPDSSSWSTHATSRAATDKANLVELNSADSLTLVGIRGIGPSFARAIIRYRARLGGFVDLGQLNEIYLFRDKPDAVARFIPFMSLDTSEVARIALNTCSVEDLGGHPYCGWKVAKALVAYRQQHGPFHSLMAITDCVLVTDSIRQRLMPYLVLE